MVTLAEAIRADFEREHPRGKNTLLCDQCRFRKDREDFRETPWHGRAVCCKRCENFRYLDDYRERQAWEVEQLRERIRCQRRYIGHLKLTRLLRSAPRTADAIRAREQPYVYAVERAAARLSWAVIEPLSKALADFMEEA
ncbi:hypothetical protein [Streptomyces chryseus]|uniref:hypothetical protein n=1 Tax=Streptomyces chryseus TaxID=68186 RepID=UPI00110FC381|nr:hypothetical protein [Streptomyces chryseus]GGX26775.1 hypothetical protein GCM10010353_47370 [Streptomyces chryseus]